MFLTQDEINHHSLCVSAVTGDPNQESSTGRCSEEFNTYLLIGDDNDTDRPNRTSKRACWCDPECTKAEASFRDAKNDSSETRSLNSFVVLDETDMHRTMNASEYESGMGGNNRPGTNWYEENFINAQDH